MPIEAVEYRLGDYGALEWIEKEYKSRTDAVTGLRNNPNAWGEEHNDLRYLFDLIGRIVRVAVESLSIQEDIGELCT
ncbi:MAG: hypothetical protein Q3972_05695 [Corynebacterium sp.]|nr:hypothetical protein [Corynebacterium sp.]